MDSATLETRLRHSSTNFQDIKSFEVRNIYLWLIVCIAEAHRIITITLSSEVIFSDIDLFIFIFVCIHNYWPLFILLETGDR